MATAQALIDDVRSLGSLASATGLDDASILAHADKEIAARFIPLLRRASEEFLVRTAEVQAVNGRVRLPSRAVLGGVRHVQISLGGNAWRSLPQLKLEDAGSSTAGTATGFYFDGAGLVLLPLGASGLVRVSYFARPGKLTTTASRYSVVTGVGAQTSTSVTLVLSGGLVASTVDVVANSSDHSQICIDGALSGGTITGSIQGQVLAGDYVCEADYSYLVPLPEELYPSLVNRTASRILLSLGYLEESNAHAQLAEIGLSEILAAVAPRSIGNPKRPTGGMLGAIGVNRTYFVRGA